LLQALHLDEGYHSKCVLLLPLHILSPLTRQFHILMYIQVTDDASIQFLEHTIKHLHICATIAPTIVMC